MEYVDWVMSAAVFFLVLVALVVTLPNYLPDTTLQSDNYISKNILSNITESTDIYFIINNSEESEYFPYMISATDGRSNSSYTTDNNKSYGVVYNTTSFYNYSDANMSYKPPGIIVIEENFEDYNYEDTFTLSAGIASTNYGKLNIDENTVLESINDYNDFTSYLNFNGDDLNIYFNYVDSSNSFLCEVTDEYFNLIDINSGDYNIISTQYIDTNIWRQIKIKSAKANNNVFCEVNDISIDYNYPVTKASGNIVIKGLDLNSIIDDFIVYKNNDLNVTSSTISTTYFDINTDSNVATINFLENYSSFGSLNLIFDNAITIEDSNGIAFGKDATDSTNKLIIFPQTKEFWFSLDSDSNIDIQLDNNIQAGNYEYYIEDNNTDKYIWTNMNLPANETKTIYIYKDSSNSPDGNAIFEFFDDFDSDSLDTNKWYEGTDVNYSISDGVITIYKNGIGLQSMLDFNLNNNYILEGKIKYLETVSGYSGNLMGCSSRFGQINNNGTDAIAYYIRSNDTMIDRWIGDGSESSYNIASGTETVNTTDNNWYILGQELLDTGINLMLNRTQQATHTFTWEKDMRYLEIGTQDVNSNIQDTSYDWVLVRKYTDNEPTITVTDLDGYYKVEITNNKTTALTDYQVKIPNDVIGVTSQTDGLMLLDNYSPINYLKLKDINYSNNYIMLNSFDNYNNNIDCNFQIITTGVRIKDCNKDSIIKVRFRKDNINTDYPKINTIKSKTEIITKEKLDALTDSNQYYLHITNKSTDIKKGLNRFTTSKLLERYFKYLNDEGIEEIVKVLIKPN